MARKRKRTISVRKMREVLRLSHLGFSQRKIAQSCNLARSTVGEYQAQAKGAGIDWHTAQNLEDRELVTRLRPPSEPLAQKQEPDYEQLRRDARQKGVTLYLLWEEYAAENPDNAYSYSQFCRRYRSWRDNKRLSMPQEHKPGEKIFIDYAGMKVPIFKPHSDEVDFEASIFIAALGLSSYTFAEATRNQELQSWLSSHCRMFRFFGGVSEILTPDNLKSGVNKPCRYDPDINPSYHNLAQHYGTCVIPARVKKPKDKPKAESAVLVAGRRVLAALRNRRFYSLADLNAAIAQLLVELNDRKTRRFPDSRRALFEQFDRPALKPLPPQPFVLTLDKEATVHIDYHVTFERHHYSVPYELVGERVLLRVSDKTVEILHQGARVALHLRSSRHWGYTTSADHMPPSHKAMNEQWTPERFLAWAKKFGPHTTSMTELILSSPIHSQQAYRSVLGLLRLEKHYGASRLEAACARALHLGLDRRKHVLNILKNKQDVLPLPELSKTAPPVLHSNIRGSRYYQ